MARFYGWSVADIDRLLVDDAFRYVSESQRIGRREMREALVVAGYPWSGEKDQRKVWAALQEPKEAAAPSRMMTPELRAQGEKIQRELDHGT